MFCYCKGALSEGINFKDKLCRSVIFIGIPYLPPDDITLKYKQQYFDHMNSPNRLNWKYIEVSRAINQALGRVIRHSNDYGSIILIDERYDKNICEPSKLKHSLKVI